MTASYYVFIENNEINGWGQARIINEEFQNIEATKEVIDELDHYFWNGTELERLSEEAYTEKIAIKNRNFLDKLTLTPSDVERALYHAKGIDFDDLKTIISQNIPTLDLKAISIEFRANNFWRGATLGTVRLFDLVAPLIGYTALDMDYLFVTHQLPTSEMTDTEKQNSINEFIKDWEKEE